MWTLNLFAVLPVQNPHINYGITLMKKPLLLPLLASSLLVACATPAQNITQNKPTVIGEQDIQRLVQEGRERALNARDVQANQGEAGLPPTVAGGMPPAPPHPVKPPIVSGGK
jgi:hypothetical protein